MALFIADNVSKHFAGHTALDRVSIRVPEGSIFGLLGPNGAGKTTLIRIINRIIGPDEGKIWFRGEEMHHKHIAHIGYLPEERGLYRKMRVGEQAMYLAQLKGLSRKTAKARLHEWFEKFGMSGWWNKKIEELSKGMQQKVQFITTILHEPELLIFDEPFSGFDPINAEMLKKEILQLREKGATVIFSTHNMASVEELCDHIALIDRSRKILEGKVKEIRKEYSTNTYRIVFNRMNGPLADILGNDFIIVDESEDDEHSCASVRIPQGMGSNDLLRRIAGRLDIHAYNEILPGMHDIFISAVKENQGK